MWSLIVNHRFQCYLPTTLCLNFENGASPALNIGTPSPLYDSEALHSICFKLFTLVAWIFPSSEINLINSVWKFYCRKAGVSCGSVTPVFPVDRRYRCTWKKTCASLPQAVLRNHRIRTVARERKRPWLLCKKNSKLTYLHLRKQADWGQATKLTFVILNSQSPLWLHAS